MQRLSKYDRKTGVARGVFYVVPIYPLLRNGCFRAVARPETIEEANNNCQSSRLDQLSVENQP
jgi:hypothetical protein